MYLSDEELEKVFENCSEEAEEITETFVCPICGANFSTHEHAENHLRDIHHIPNEILGEFEIEKLDIRNIC